MSRKFHHTEEKFSDEQTTESINADCEGSLSFNPTRSQPNGDSLNAEALEFLQDSNHTQFPITSASPISLSVSGEPIPDGLALATSRNNLFHSFTDMADIWRTPAIVGTLLQL